MKKAFKITSLLLLILLSVSACGSNSKSSDDSNDLIGKWTQKLSQEGMEIKAQYDFRSDGTAFQSMVLKSSNPKIDIEAEGEFDYEYEGNTIIFTFSGKDIEFKKCKIEGLPQDYIDAIMEQVKEQMAAEQTQVLNDVKINGNTLTAIFNGVEIALTR